MFNSIRKCVRSMVLRFGFRLNLLVAWIFRRLPRRLNSDKILVFTVSRVGSLGDQAILYGVLEGIRQLTSARVELATRYNETEADFAELLGRFENIGVKRFSPRLGGLVSQFQLILQRSEFGFVMIPGADTLDGFYSEEHSLLRLRLAHVSAVSGYGTGLLGFSFNAEPPPSIIKAFKDLPMSVTILCRDEVSRGRLSGIMGHRVGLSADFAFAMCPESPAAKIPGIINWLSNHRSGGGMSLGFCPNVILAKKYTRSALTKFYVDILNGLSVAYPKAQFLLFPHDYRGFQGEDGDVRFCEEIVAASAPALRDSMRVITTELTAAEVKSLVSMLDFVFTARMHCAIACLGGGVPACAASYQGKFEGLYNHYDMPELLLNDFDMCNASATCDEIINLVAHIPELKQRVSDRVGLVLHLSLLNQRLTFKGGISDR